MLIFDEFSVLVQFEHKTSLQVSNLISFVLIFFKIIILLDKKFLKS